MQAVVAVDGTAGSGKSSVSRGAAQILGMRYLDTGAMYRAAALWCLRHGVDVDDPAAVAAVAQQPQIVVRTARSRWMARTPPLLFAHRRSPQQ